MCKENEITKTRFITVQVGDTQRTGIPIGEGKCKAVRLRINALARNLLTPATGDPNAPLVAYYGDAKSQENELTALFTISANRSFLHNDWTPKIYCTDLSQVFIRQPANIANPIYVQVMIMD